MNHIITRKKHINRFVPAVIVILMAIIGGYFFIYPSDNIPIHKIQFNFREAQQLTEKILSEIASSINEKDNEEDLVPVFTDLAKQYGDKKLFFYRFSGNHLKNWSSNELNITPDLLKIPNKTVIAFDHNILQLFKQKTKNGTLLGVIVIRRDYYVHNKYLKGENNFGIPQDIEIVLTTKLDEMLVKNTDNKPAFSLKKTANKTENKTLEDLFFLIFLVGFAFLLSAVIQMKNKYLVVGILAFLWLFRMLSLSEKFPEAIYNLALFQPFTYSYNAWMFSLGDTLINVILIFFSVLLLKKFLTGKQSLSIFLLPINILILGGVFELIFIFLKSLIFDSNLNFLFFSLTTINTNQFFALVSIVVLLFAFYHLAIIVLSGFLTQRHKILYFISSFIAGSGLFVYQILQCSHCWFTGMIIGTVFVFFLWILYFLKDKKPSFPFVILNIGFVSLILALLFFFFTEKKVDATKRLVIVKLANERDFVAESILPELGHAIHSDTTLTNLLFSRKESFEKINVYLNTKYFQGFWNNFDFQVTVCNPYDSLNILENSEVENCFIFFDDLKKMSGVQLSDTNFYFLDNNNGRISYLGILPFYRDGKLIRLFLEIDSKLISVKLGYPGLLINGKTQNIETHSKIFYAKYKNGKLIAQMGNYAYPIIDRSYRKQLNGRQFLFVKMNKFKHLIYQKDNQTVIVLTSLSNSFWEFLLEFSYLFLFGVIVGMAIKIFKKKNFYEWFKSLNFKRRIQLTILGTLFSFFVIVGTLTAFFIYYQLQDKFQEEMSERIESVRVELTHKIASFPNLSLKESGYLNSLLVKFSTVFLTDIHLFLPDGQLIATSRPQIFEKNIEGEMLDINALQALEIQKVSKFVHTEQIGKLKFLSAYIPFFNDQNKLIAYLNLPYFTRQSEITQQLSQIIVTIINVFILLILISFLAVVVVAEQLTRPLAVIREHIQQLQFGGKNKTIHYVRRDEIGNLIAEYNRMVGELEKSAELLAQSERESAWRDMAKQVAHEIKNPLTPMKLSVQHLQKSWNSHHDNLEAFINHIAENLIEQIDALTVIANEFSNFAKMPQTKEESFNPIEKLEKIVSLFKNNTNFNLRLLTDDATKDIRIKMDKEQFTIVFNNLIKNAIQAIPSTRKGEITVKAKVEQKFFLVEVSDNGIGIAKENQNHVFLPNFTTKTSGMGIGLSIVKTIMDNVNGEIRFESKQGEETKFILKFPME